MNIAIDAHGGDFGVVPNVEGALLAVKQLDCMVTIVGREEEIRKALGEEVNNPKIKITHAPDIIEMEAEPVQECRNKPDSSMMRGAELVAKGEANAFVSAGNSGAVMVASFMKIGRLPGVSRPAIAVAFPTLKGASVLIDGGANMDCKPIHLAQFALMGTVYAQRILNIATPSVGLLSVGEEETKGNALVHETIPILKNSGLNYYGTVEGGDLPRGTVDVVVCDGYVGNICLKLSEGLAKVLIQMIKDEVAKSLFYKLGALLMKGAFKKLKMRTSPDEYGGAPLLGVDGTVLICHGKSNSKAIFNAVRVAAGLAKANANEKIREGLEEMKDILKKLKEDAKEDALL